MTPKVSVMMITYNHGRFIEQAVASVLAQRVSFEYEVVIGDDCSTDDTGAILQRIAREDPRVRLLKRNTNLGMMQNFIGTYAECRGEYIAFLEGDDYWTSPDKLQMQIDSLDNNPEWSLCFHHVVYVDSESRPVGYTHPPAHKPIFTLQDLFPDNPIQTCSVVLRRSVIPKIPDWFHGLALGDWPLFICAAIEGPLGMLSGPMAHYRIHGSGCWSSKAIPEKLLAVLDMFTTLAENSDAATGDLCHKARLQTIQRLVDRESDIRRSLAFRMSSAFTYPLRRAKSLLGI